jgi:hypothetical protein
MRSRDLTAGGATSGVRRIIPSPEIKSNALNEIFPFFPLLPSGLPYLLFFRFL